IQGGNFDILLSNGDGTFAPYVTYKTGVQPFAIATGDFNHDGIPDIAVVNGLDGPPVGRGILGDISMLLGTGNGAFTQRAVTIATTVSQSNLQSDVVAGDFNGDGIPDLAIGDPGAGKVRVRLGSGDGTFAPTFRFEATTGGSPTWVSAADFNGDGRLD